MSLIIGGINLFQQGLDSEYRITVLEKIVEKIVNKRPGILSEDDVKTAKNEAILILQNKYPQAGIKEGDV